MEGDQGGDAVSGVLVGRNWSYWWYGYCSLPGEVREQGSCHGLVGELLSSGPFSLSPAGLFSLSSGISEGTRRKKVSVFGVLGRNVTGKLIYPGRGGVVRQNLRQSVACFSLIVIFASM